MDVAPQYEAFSYQRRVKEQTLLYRVLAGNLETFLDRRRSEEHELPRYVETVLAGMTAASVRGLVATAMPRAVFPSTPRRGPLLATGMGWSGSADTSQDRRSRPAGSLRFLRMSCSSS